MGRSRSIFYVIGSTDIGGAEMHLLRVVRELAKKGWDISVYSLADAGKLAPAFEAAGVRVLHPPRPLEGLSAIRKLYRLLQIILQFLRFWLDCLRLKPTIAHFFLPAAYLVGAPAAWLARVPVRLMSRRSLNIYQQKHSFLAKVEHFLHKSVHGILGNSKAVLANLIDDENVPEDRVNLIYNGIETKNFAIRTKRETLRTALGLASSDLVMIIVANLIPYKGHKDLLDALHLAGDKLPSEAHLICVGGGEAYQDELLGIVSGYGLKERVHFLGQRQDVPDLLAMSDLALLCSHEEGFSNAVLEAMASALPIIVTRVGGNPDVVIDGENGLIVAPCAPQELSNAICTLSSDKAMRENMGQKAQQLIQSRFSLDHCVSQYEQMYTNLVSGKAFKNSLD